MESSSFEWFGFFVMSDAFLGRRWKPVDEFVIAVFDPP
jgi:hypothetical protein